MEWLTLVLIAGIVFFWVRERTRKVAKPSAAAPRPSSYASSGKARPAAVGGTPSPRPVGADPARGSRTILAPTRWHGPGDVVEIAGQSIAGGLIHVGGELPDPRGGGNDRCLVDPSLRVATSRPDVAGATVPYWPSYGLITPNARLAYLQWLASGRRDPAYGIGYPFLFLYGLERRLLHDKVIADAALVASEMDELLSVYGENGSFRHYGTKLRDAAIALRGDAPAPVPRHDMQNGSELPFDVRAHVGRRLVEGRTLTDKDALLWILGMPDTRIRTPVERCFPEFQALWKARFDARHPAGLKVSKPKSKLRIRYAAASSAFDANIPVSYRGEPIPDVANLSAPLGWMRETFDACVEDLSPYSRLLGRRPEARGTVEGVLLLPEAIRDAVGGTALASLRASVVALLEGRNFASVPAAQLIGALGVASPPVGKATAGFCNQVGVMLDGLDLALEPDRRHGSGAFAMDGTVTLFEAMGGAPIDGSRDAYRAARTMVEVSVLAAASDGSADDGEFEALRQDIVTMPDLSATERARLVALAVQSRTGGPKQGSVLSKLAKVPSSEKRRVVRSALSAVLADGHASPAEVRFLERLHKTLGLPVDEVYAALHRGSVDIDEPVVVAREEVSTGVPIPDETKASSTAVAPSFAIDQARLDRIRSETSAVSTLLAGIFVDDECEATMPEATVEPRQAGASASDAGARFTGLDAAHGSLLQALVAADPMDRATFDALARTLRLMPDGAIETINEWSFDRYDEPAIEGDDSLEVSPHLRRTIADELETA